MSYGIKNQQKKRIWGWIKNIFENNLSIYMHGSFIRSPRLIYIESRDIKRDIKRDVIHRLAADYIFTSHRSLKKDDILPWRALFYEILWMDLYLIGLPNAHNCHVAFVFIKFIVENNKEQSREKSIFRASPYVVHRTNVHTRVYILEIYIHILVLIAVTCSEDGVVNNLYIRTHREKRDFIRERCSRLNPYVFFEGWQQNKHTKDRYRPIR